MRYIFLLFLACSFGHIYAQPKTIGKIVRIDPAFDALVDKSAAIEVLAGGMMWTEGPVWSKQLNSLLFSDVPANTIYRWTETGGTGVFLNPSGYTGMLPYSNEPGSNGLIINKQGQLVSCEHGDRRISAMPLINGGKRTLADNWKGQLFNSPNDIVQRSNGDYYFSDPIYGLPEDSVFPARKKGLYMIRASGEVLLLTDSLLPNGVAFSPDEKVFYVTHSLNNEGVIMKYELAGDGRLLNGKVFFNPASLSASGLPGGVDGMKSDSHGNLFASGPGGILIINPNGKLIGRLEINQPTSNCAWGPDGYLYITSSRLLCRVKTKTSGKF